MDACSATTGRRGELGVNLDRRSRKAEADNVRDDAVNGFPWSIVAVDAADCSRNEKYCAPLRLIK